MAWSAVKLAALTQPPSAHVVPPLAERLELPSSTRSMSAQLVEMVLLAARRSFSNHGSVLESRFGNKDPGYCIALWRTVGLGSRTNFRYILQLLTGPVHEWTKDWKGSAISGGKYGMNPLWHEKCTPVDTHPSIAWIIARTSHFIVALTILREILVKSAGKLASPSPGPTGLSQCQCLELEASIH
jgi:hypothetical protein